MNSQTGFIIKILLFSTALSVLIKYGGRYLPIQPTNAIATIIVILPSLIIGLILGWQYLNPKV
ncbi:hypothetical protein I4641_18945 [Waterburya agarophytonicola K14]|uniref:Uncharacterized protein n=1 Tax=Waterburya agarophytonicola KI4 TaxID=2874699 RepID=A0A964FGL4_9CYAN|nr:hypothetical protein [Waterburya agarophytonicola]MCC0179050.1 hypothetical protein [Waterburya agarophytonicola KI4]